MKVTRKNKFWVGLFMASGVIIGVLIFFWLGVATFLEEGKRYVTYFDQSVQGLAVDSPVKFRGVAIGRVVEIKVAPDARHVEVVMIIEQDLDIRPGIFARLSLVGITGIMFVELDVMPGEAAAKPPELPFEPPYPVIPARPSEISMIVSDVERVLSTLNQLDLKGLSTQASETLRNFDRAAKMFQQAIDQLQVEKTVSSFQALTETMRQELRQAGEILEQTGRMLQRYDPEIEAALGDFRSAMAKLDQFAGQANELADETDANLTGLFRDLMIISRELEQTILRLDTALEEFIASPQMLFREPPPPRRLE